MVWRATVLVQAGALVRVVTVGFGAWFSWALSVTATLASHFTAQAALRRAVQELDSGKWSRGGYYDRFTAILNAAAGVLFVVGVFLVGAFVWRNV